MPDKSILTEKQWGALDIMMPEMSGWKVQKAIIEL